MKTYSYLALGDSYTIGEQVRLVESFPYQTVQLLRKNGLPFYAPEIIAATGWTTDELNNAIEHTATLGEYDFVSLLIGVNNQYRSRSVNEFTIEFEHLLQRAIQFTGNQPRQVFVISIPDWGITPFAEGRNRKKIAEEINAFNAVCASAATKFNTPFIDITTSYRKDGIDPEFIAADGLHPSGSEYSKWADKLFKAISKDI